MNNNLAPKVVFISTFILYCAWGGYWVFLCVNAIAEECIAARWALTMTGFPLSLILSGLGGVGIGELVATTIVGGLQWAFVFSFITHLFLKRKKISQLTSH